MKFTGPDNVPVSGVILSREDFRRLMADVHRGYQRRHEERIVKSIPNDEPVTAAQLRARLGMPEGWLATSAGTRNER